MFRSLRDHRPATAYLSPVLSIFLTLILFGCNSESTPEKKLSGIPEEVTICHSARIDTLVLVAQDLGYFAEHNISIALRQHSTGGRSLKAMLEGECSMAVCGGTPFAFKSFEHSDLRIISLLGYSNTTVKIVARNDRGIYKPYDLKGKAVAAQKGTVFHYFLYLFLSKHGLLTGDINLVFEKTEEMKQEEIWNKFDAVATKEPYASEALSYLGENAVVFKDHRLHNSTFNLVSKNSYIQENRAIIERVLKALLKADSFVAEYPEKTFEIISNTHKYDRDKWQRIMSGLDLTIALDQSLLLRLENTARWMIHEGLVTQEKVPNYLDYLYTDGLKALKPDAVTIIQ